MATLPDDLQDALDTALRRFPRADLARAVDRLIARYREGLPATSGPIMKSDLDVAAYAGYRMPATYAAVSSVLAETARLAPDFAPRSLVDLGGGTGAALWAAAATWPSLTTATVVEEADPVLALGSRLAAASTGLAVRRATWRRGLIDPRTPVPDADLVTLSYVLGELPEPTAADVVRRLAGAAGVVVLVEPGTPAGYARIVAARDLLLERGMTVFAPCPHLETCPIPRGADWCHFSARLPRLGFHQVIKDGVRNFEDEKFSYVVASAQPRDRAPNRVLRHPQKRKNLVSLRLCTGAGTLDDVLVTKRTPEPYRAARDVRWGEQWPPSEAHSSPGTANR